MRLVNTRRGPGLLDFEGSGLPISVATWPASAEKGWLRMGSMKIYIYRGAAARDLD